MLGLIRNNLEQLQEKGEDIEIWEAASEADISKIEHQLDIHIPSELRELLKEFGGFGIAAGPWICGIDNRSQSSENIFSIVGATNYCRKRKQIQNNLIVIRLEPDDLIICIDSKEKEEKSKVYSVNPQNPQKISKISENIQEYLRVIFDPEEF